MGEQGGGVAIAPSAEIARLTLGMPSTGGGGVEASLAYSEQEHSGKTKATLDGILGTRSLLQLRRREILILHAIVNCCFSTGEMRISLCGGEAQFDN